MRILITGSHGFVGTNLIEVLSRQHEIIQWNVREDKPLPEVDVVIHLAGLVHDTKHTYKKEAYYQVNTTLTQQIYDRFLDSNAKKFIFFSSIKAKDYDTPYAQSKKVAENYILNTNITHLINKSVYILRPCMIHGKGMKGNFPLLFNWVKKGLPWPLAVYENQRSYASMGNVSFVVDRLIKEEVHSGIYNICDDEMVSTNELIALMGECIGHQPKMLRVPKNIVRYGAKMGDWLHLPLNTERLMKLTSYYTVDNSDIKHALGIHQMPVRSIDGLRSTIYSMIENSIL